MRTNREDIERLREAYRVNPNDRSVAVDLAQKYADVGWLNEALKLYRECINKYPDDYTLILEYANICYRKEKFDEAYNQFQKLTIIKPNRIEGWNNLGIIQLKTADLVGAKASFEKVLTLEDDNVGALLNLGNYYTEIGDATTAIKKFKQVTSIKIAYPDGWFNLGNAYCLSKEYHKAIFAYKKAIKYNPKFFSAFKNCGFAYEQINDLEKALTYYSDALCFSRADSQLYVNIASVYYKKGDYDLSKENYHQAVKLSPYEPAGWMGLRTIAFSKGDIKTYVKATLAIIARLSESEIAQSCRELRRINHIKDIKQLIVSADKIDVIGDLIDAERMLVYYNDPDLKVRSKMIFKRLSSIPVKDDCILRSLAFYSYNTNQFHDAVAYYKNMDMREAHDELYFWRSLISNGNYVYVEEVLKNYMKDHIDFPEAWFELAKVKLRLNSDNDARNCFLRSLELGFSDDEQIDNEPSLKELYNSLYTL